MGDGYGGTKLGGCIKIVKMGGSFGGRYITIGRYHEVKKMTTFTPRKKKNILKKQQIMTKVKIRKKEVATLVARCLLEQIGGKNETGLQRKIRQDSMSTANISLRSMLTS